MLVMELRAGTKADWRCRPVAVEVIYPSCLRVTGQMSTSDSDACLRLVYVVRTTWLPVGRCDCHVQVTRTRSKWHFIFARPAAHIATTIFLHDKWKFAFTLLFALSQVFFFDFWPGSTLVPRRAVGLQHEPRDVIRIVDQNLFTSKVLSEVFYTQIVSSRTFEEHWANG